LVLLQCNNIGLSFTVLSYEIKEKRAEVVCGGIFHITVSSAAFDYDFIVFIYSLKENSLPIATVRVEVWSYFFIGPTTHAKAVTRNFFQECFIFFVPFTFCFPVFFRLAPK